jgi:hypothetical protein
MVSHEPTGVVDQDSCDVQPPVRRVHVVQDSPRGNPASYESSREENRVDTIGTVQVTTPPLQCPVLTSLTEPVSGAHLAPTCLLHRAATAYE